MSKFQKGDIIEAKLRRRNGYSTRRGQIVGISDSKYTIKFEDAVDRRLEYIHNIDRIYYIPKEYDNPLWRKLEGKD